MPFTFPRLTLSIVALPLFAAAIAAPPPAKPEPANTTATALIEMVSISGGTFQMGSKQGPSEMPIHPVTLSPFRMGRTEVSYAQWTKVCDWATAHGYYFNPEGKGMLGGRYIGASPQVLTDPRHPVTRVGWWEAVTWCNALSEMEGRTPCYYAGGDQPVVFRGTPEPQWTGVMSVRWQADGYRLPTEAEWEYACRAGSTTEFYWGDDPAVAGKYANVFDETAQEKYHQSTHIATTDGFTDTSPVGSLAPNAFGLYDLSGNVWEWCHDFYGPYSAGAVTDPHGPEDAKTRARRGGSFQNRSMQAQRSASRSNHLYEDRGQMGFRVVTIRSE